MMNPEICQIPRWQQVKARLNNLDYESFIAGAKEDAAVLLDVRTPKEFEIDHLPGAINLDYLSSDLADQLEALDRSKSYYIYCRTGRRALRICVLLTNLGFDKVYNLSTGLAEVRHA